MKSGWARVRIDENNKSWKSSLARTTAVCTIIVSAVMTTGALLGGNNIYNVWAICDMGPGHLGEIGGKAIASAAAYYCHQCGCSVVSKVYMNTVEHRHNWCKLRSGIMNPYGSEGPTKKERQLIKENKRHGLLCASNNQNSIQSAYPYMAESKADVMFLQELNQKADKFEDSKNKLAKGKYVPRQDSQAWKCEGTPSIDGPNEGASGGRLLL